MVDLMSLLSDALIGSFQMFMLNDFGKNMFPYRIKTCWKRILIYGVTALVILSVNHIESTFINIMMIPVSYTIASIVIFQGSVWKKIILACCYYMLAIVPEFLFAVITGAYGVTGTENNFHSELEKLLSLLLMSTITFLLVKCVNQITRKKNYQTIENKLFTVLLTLPAATIIIFMCIYYSQISYTGVNRIMIPIGAALLLMTNICIFAVFDKLIEKSEEVKKMELLYQKSKAENINQKYINKVNEDKRVFLHDVNKFLCTAASLIENGKNLELDSMVRHLGIRMEELKNYSYCADPVLNSILCERKFVAESKGILYKIKLGNNLRTDFIEDLDLISIVGNLLDNAIEAAEKTKKDQHVICNMYMGNEGHLLVMEFYNSYILPLIKENSTNDFVTKVWGNILTKEIITKSVVPDLLKSIDLKQIKILDYAQELCPPDVKGQVYVSESEIMNDRNKTYYKILEHPLYGRMADTGIIGVLTHDGYMEFVVPNCETSVETPDKKEDTHEEEIEKPIVKEIMKIWKEVFEIEDISIQDDFYTLGGDSIILMRLVDEMCKTLGCDVTVDDILQSENISDLANRV